MIASHYAAPVERRLVHDASLFDQPDEASPVARLIAGDPFELLDDSLGWAWGYAGPERRVGYVKSGCLGA